MMILPLLLGIGVDNGIHMVHRWTQEEERTTFLNSTTLAILVASLTTIFGFGSLIFASHQGIASLGIVLVLGVGCMLVASFTLVPALLRLWRIT